MGKIKVAIAGVGNCASSLVQGLFYYKNVDSNGETVPGLMHNVLGGYRISDIKPVAAFDIDSRKVGKDISEAIFAPPNCTTVFQKNVPKTGAEVHMAPAMDGVAKHMFEHPVERTFALAKKTPVDVAKVLKEVDAEVLINYMPVGSEEATKHYAEAALKSGCAFINCMPAFIASKKDWTERFEKAKLPTIGDDIKSQVGATITHRMLARLFAERGVKIVSSYQLNVGGNSVTGDQEILLRRNGKIVKTKIGEFIDQLMELYGEKREDGKDMVDLSKAPENIKCFTIDENFRVIESNVSALVRHRLNEELYEIEAEGGRKIKITKDHNVFALNDNGELEAVPACNLTKETRIAVPRTLPAGEEDLNNISLVPYLKELFAQGMDPEGNIIIHNHPEIRIPVNFPLTDELLQMAGLWLADGSFDRVGSGNLEIACGNDTECMEILDRFTEQYNIGYEIRGKKQVSVRIRSKTLANIFKLALGLGGNSYTKRVPDWTFGLSERQIALVLKGYISGDGTVTGKQIRWTTASEGLAEDIQTLFLRIGINSTLFREDYSTKNLKGSFRTSLPYITHGIISSKAGIEAFIEKVGFIQRQKNEKSRAASAQLTKGGMNIIPKFNALRRWGIRSENWPKWPTIRAHIVLSQLDKVKEEADMKKLRDICTGDALFVKIKSVKKVKAKPQYVYDLSVPGYERFICSNILVHNTDFLNMLERARLKSKKISKTQAVQSILPQKIDDYNLHISPSDYVPWLKDKKLCFLRIEGKKFGDVPINIEVRLEVEDSPNSAGVVIDAIRCAKLGLDRGIGGPLKSASAYFMKSPIEQYPDPVARQMVEEFIEGKRDR